MTVFKRMAAGVLALSMVAAVVGCGGASALTADEVAQKAVTGYSEVKTVKMDMDMTMDLSMSGGEQPMDLDMSIGGTGTVNVPEKQMHLSMDMEMNVPMLGNQEVSMDMYLMDDWMYMKAGMLGFGDEWMKMKLAQNAWAQQNQLGQYIDVLETAVEVQSLPDEKVNGVDCYVLSVTPDMAALSSLLTSQMPQQTDTSFLEDLDFSKIMNDITLKVWLSKKDYLPAKSDVSMSFNLSAEDLGAEPGEFDSMSMTMTTQVTYSDYNKPVTITLPVEASSAKES